MKESVLIMTHASIFVVAINYNYSTTQSTTIYLLASQYNHSIQHHHHFRSSFVLSATTEAWKRSKAESKHPQQQTVTSRRHERDWREQRARPAQKLQLPKAAGHWIGRQLALAPQRWAPVISEHPHADACGGDHVQSLDQHARFRSQTTSQAVD